MSNPYVVESVVLVAQEGEEFVANANAIEELLGRRAALGQDLVAALPFGIPNEGLPRALLVFRKSDPNRPSA